MPLWCILIYYPVYILVLESIVFGQRSDIMIDQIFPTMENMVLVLVVVIAILTEAYGIYTLLHNEYADTRKRKLTEQLEAVQSGAEVNQLVLDQYSAFDRTFTKVMIPSIVVASFLTIFTVIGAGYFYEQFTVIYIAPVVTFLVGIVYALVFEEICQKVAGGTVTVEYGDKVLATIKTFLKDAVPSVSEAEQAALAEMEKMKAEYEAKFGKKI